MRTIARKMYLVLAAVASALLIASCSVGEGSAPAGDINQPSSAVATPAKAHTGLTAKDVRLSFVETSRECFGSAGCNVGIKVHADVDHSKLLDSAWDVTYQVRGGDEPQLQTFTINPDGSYDPPEAFLAVVPKNAKLAVTVTRVERDGL